MHDLLVRTISGIGLILVVFGSILLSGYSMMAIIVVINFLGLMEFTRMYRLKDIFLVFLILIGGSAFILVDFFVLSGNLHPDYLLLTFILNLLFLCLHYILKKESSLKETARILFGMVWISGSLTLYMSLGWAGDQEVYRPHLLILLLSLIWINDVGAYMVGTWIGKHKLAPSISPSKSWEGFAGGILLNGVAGYAAYRITGEYSAIVWILASVLISLTAVAGDLFQSKLKREAGIKDSGSLIPGHGGILDRFDSLFLSAAVFYIVIQRA